MQAIVSAFKRSSDKKHKRLLQDSLMSSTDTSFSRDENARPNEGLVSRLGSLKPTQLLHTPSPSKLGRHSATPRPLDHRPLQALDNTGTIDVVNLSLAMATCPDTHVQASCIQIAESGALQPLLSPKAAASPFAAAQPKRERSNLLSASKPPRKGQNSRLPVERSISSMSSPAFTPSRLRTSQDTARTPLTHSIRKHRGMKAAEERALATEHEHSALSTATDNVQVSMMSPAAQHLPAISSF